jgi:hypothetical protein
MTLGRNDPCPCGSGKKFKRCHGASVAGATASPLVSRAEVLKDRDAELSNRLMRWARKRHGADWVGSLFDSTAHASAGGLSEPDLPIVIPWLLHMRLDDAEATLDEAWIRESQTRLSPDDALIIDAYREAWVSIWEVSGVEAGIGVRFDDLLTGETRFVHDVNSSSALQSFDVVLAVILTCDGVSFFGGLHGYPLTPRFAEIAVREARRLCRVRTRPVRRERLRGQGLQLALFALWSAVADSMQNQPPPVLENTDGDPMQATRDEYSLVASRDDVARGLQSVRGVEDPEVEAGNTVFTVTKAGNAMHGSWTNTIVARIVLSATRLSVETNSVRRADAMRATIDARLGGLVRFRLRKEDNTSQMVAAAMAGGAKSRDASPRNRRGEGVDDESQAAVREFREQHMRGWIDDSIPALGGLTPREAARSPGIRPRLEALLKEFQQREAAQPESQRVDLKWIWDELGLS